MCSCVHRDKCVLGEPVVNARCPLQSLSTLVLETGSSTESSLH